MPKKRQPPQKKVNDKEGNKYDKIIKENLQSLIPALLKSVMNLTDIRLENLPQVKLQTTVERARFFKIDVFKRVSQWLYPAN